MQKIDDKLSKLERNEILDNLKVSELKMICSIDELIQKEHSRLDIELSHIAWKTYHDLPYSKDRLAASLICGLFDRIAEEKQTLAAEVLAKLARRPSVEAAVLGQKPGLLMSRK